MDDDDDHPLLVELNSLRKTAARFQHEAHVAAIKLQRHSLDTSRIHDHATTLEQENARLTHEIDILRANPDVPHHPAVVQVQELSLALRRVSDKITLTEDTLLERTSELAHTRSELVRARHTADDAYDLAARLRAREEAAKARERELELKARASEEERKMVDLVVQEYADLVRNLEGRKSANHTPPTPNRSASMTPLVDILRDGKSSLHSMLTAFSTETENLHTTIAELSTKVSFLQTTLDAERLAASHDRALLSQAKTELDKLHLEDQTAAKMVARYMKFSQSSTNALQQQITTLKARHTSTIATLELRLSVTESKLASERVRNLRLQDALDELCEDLARESYGRRREVALRLALLSREEGVAEFLRRWARRARELYARCYHSVEPLSSEDAVQEAFYRVVADAESLLSTLDDDLQFSDGTRTSGSMARIALSKAAVDALRDELQDEVQKRMEAIRRGAFSLPNGETISKTEDSAAPENIPPQEGDGTPSQSLPEPNGDANLEREVSPQPQDAKSLVGAPSESIDDPFVISAPPVVDVTEHVTTPGIPSPSIQDGTSTSITLFVGEEAKVVQPDSPAVSMLDLREDSLPSLAEEPPTAGVVSIHALSTDTPLSDVRVLVEDTAVFPTSTSVAASAVQCVSADSQPSYEQEPSTADVPIRTLPSDTTIADTQYLTQDDKIVPSPLLSTPMSATSPGALSPPSPTDVSSTLFTELSATNHRYDALQRAFRDCSLALKELKRTLASYSPSPHTQTKLRQHLATALARIDDYAEDARVELEIRVADEELTARGFEMMLSVPGALADGAERAEAEVSAWAFVDGTEEGVAKALDKFGKKLEDVQHDVAVVKRAVHGLAMEDGEDVDESKDAGTGWTAWTAGLLGASTTPTRSPTPVETFGAVMTSPQLRHATSLKELHAHESAPDHGPLAGLDLRIPMPSASLSPSHAGLGRPMEGETRPGTLSAMYAVGGLRSSSFGFGVGFGSSSSPARPRGATGLGMGIGNISSPLGGGDARGDTRGMSVADGEVNDLGGVE